MATGGGGTVGGGSVSTGRLNGGCGRCDRGETAGVRGGQVTAVLWWRGRSRCARQPTGKRGGGLAKGGVNESRWVGGKWMMMMMMVLGVTTGGWVVAGTTGRRPDSACSDGWLAGGRADGQASQVWALACQTGSGCAIVLGLCGYDRRGGWEAARGVREGGILGNNE